MIDDFLSEEMVGGTKIMSESGTMNEVSSSHVGKVLTKSIIQWRQSMTREKITSRLEIRRQLFKKRTQLNDCALWLAIFGMVMIVIDTELEMDRFYQTDTGNYASLLIKLACSISTFILLVSLLWYHVLDVKLYMCDNSLTDWKLAMSLSRLKLIALEIFICAMHPLPGSHGIFVSDLTGQTRSEISVRNLAYFVLPMLLRLFLAFRSMVLHSALYKKASAQNIGAFMSVRVDFRLVSKATMNIYPIYALSILTLALLLVGSWLMRACETTSNNPLNIVNSMWLVATSFTTIGYGDYVSSTSCGRAVSIMSSILGAGCTAFMLAMLARKLDMSRMQQGVHNFAVDIQLYKKYRVLCADIIKRCWKMHRKRRLGKSVAAVEQQRQLMSLIGKAREVRHTQQEHIDNHATIREAYLFNDNLRASLLRCRRNHTQLHIKVVVLQDKISDIDGKLDRLTELAAAKKARWFSKTVAAEPDPSVSSKSENAD